MMGYFTKDEARLAARSTLSKSRMNKTAAQVLKEESTTVGGYDQFDVFLSHSISDAELVLGVKIILEGKGFKVYVDWVNDPQLSRESVDKETASLIRTRMKQSKSLIYIATDNASNSKWMPWELGYFDGYSKGNVAVLPLVDNSYSSFKGQEYLGIYPVVKNGEYTHGAKDTFVESSGVGWTTLSSFGKGNPQLSPYS